MGWHIVHVLSSMCIGGQERVALDLSAGFLARGHRVTAVSFMRDGELRRDFEALGAAVVELPKSEGVDGQLFFRMLRTLKRLRPDVVHTHNPQPLLYTAPAARALGVRAMVHTKHGANPDLRRRVALRRLVARLCGAYVAVSEETAEQAQKLDQVAPPRLVVIRNGIDLGRFHPDPALRAEVRRELGIPADAWVVGTVGRLVAQKGQAEIIEAMAQLRATAPASAPANRLLIVGDGEERQHLEQAAAAHADRVLLLGARKDVPRLLQAMDVFCLNSVTEGLPLVIPEAMATGLPVVATAVGGVPSVVMEGETGFLVPAGQPEALVAGLARLRDDPRLGRALGEQGRARALDRYGVARMVAEYEAVYQRLLAAPGEAA